MKRRVLVGTFAGAVLTTTALGVLALPAHAASRPNPCKLLKTSEISQQFGGATVSPGKKGLSTAISTQCDFEVAAGADFPSGTVTVHVLSPRGKAAFKAVEGGFQPVSGEKGLLYWDKTGSSEMLKGDTLVGVQGVFLGDTLPITPSDVKTQVIALNKVALKRV